MRRILLVVLVAVMFTAGCGGVWVNAEYRVLLDKTTAWSNAVAERGEINELTLEEAVKLLRMNATLWRDFQDASLGIAPPTAVQTEGIEDAPPRLETTGMADFPCRLAITGAVKGGD